MHKFKKIKSDEHSTTLQHPEGHSLTIAHAALTPKTLHQLKAIPMAEGGGVEAPSNSGAPEKPEHHISEQAAYIQANPHPPKNSIMYTSEKKPITEIPEAKYADGGAVRNKMPVEAEGQREDIETMNHGKKPAPKTANGIPYADNQSSPPIRHYDVGGQVADKTPDTQDAAAQQPQAPVTINIGTPGASGSTGVSGSTGPAAQTPLEQTGATANPQGIQDAPPAPQQTQAPAQPAEPFAPTPGIGGQAPLPTPQPQMTSAQSPQQPSGPNDPFGTEAYYKSLAKGIGEQKAGINQQAGAEGQLGQQQSDTLSQNVAQQQIQQRTYQDHFNQLDAERQAFQQDINNQHIDPKHYLNSMGTGQKIATGIGLILGGMGGGLTHQQNPALMFLENQINKDIDAQKANLGKTENLLSANMRQFGNLRDATDMTRVMQSDIISNQLKQEAAKAQSPLAKARALQAIGTIDANNAQALSQIAMRRTLLSGANNGRVDPAAVVNMIIPEHQRAEANKELTTAQNMGQARDNLMSAFNQLTGINTVGQRITSPIQTSKQVEAIKGPLLAQLVKDSEGRITPQDVPMIESLFPAPGDDQRTNAIKRQRLAQFVSEKMHFPILHTYGIDPTRNSGRFNNQGQSRIQESAPVIK